MASELLIGQNSKYSDQTRREAAALMLVHGNMTKVGGIMGIPITTIADWRKSDWWDRIQSEMRQEKEDEIKADLSRIIDKAHEQTIDRLENGEAVLVKEGGEFVEKRVPVKAKDAMTIGAIATDKSMLYQNRPTRITSNEGINMLEQFAEITAKWEREREEKVVSEQ